MYFSSAMAGFNAKAKNGGNKPFVGRAASDLHLLKVDYPIKKITAVICYAWMIAVFINSKNGNTIQAIEDYD